MIENRPAGAPFQEGDQVVLAEGSHQGTPGVFLGLREDPSWADITERNGRVRSHPLVWLAHAKAAVRTTTLNGEQEHEA